MEISMPESDPIVGAPSANLLVLEKVDFLSLWPMRTAATTPMMRAATTPMRTYCHLVRVISEDATNQKCAVFRHALLKESNALFEAMRK
jgi:hypothetical protein